MKKFFATLILLMLFATTALGAGNPFADVPADHWSYDAVALLASRGGIRGHANAKLRGGRQATRYEMASLVARTLEKIDTEKISTEDRELLQKLASEFKGELDAMGLKVTELKDRVSSLRKDLGKLRLKGVLWLDAEWGGSDNEATAPAFGFYEARFDLEKRINRNTFFYMRVYLDSLEGKDADAFVISRLHFSTKLPYGIKATFGYQVTDWDDEYYLYDDRYSGWGDENPFWSWIRFIGIDLRKDFGKYDVDFYLGRNHDGLDNYDGDFGHQAFMTYGLKLGYKSEKFKFGLFGRYAKFDGDAKYSKCGATDVANYGIYTCYEILGGFDIRGTFNHQEFSDEVNLSESITGVENSDYWQVVAEAEQSLLKICSLWLQYGQVGSGFIHNDEAFDSIGNNNILTNFGGEEGIANTDYSFWKIGLNRKFTKKLKGYVAYSEFDNKNGAKDISKTKDFSFGFKYQYSPSVAFQLQYDWRDYGDGEDNEVRGTEDLFRFRTIISF